MKLFKNQAGFNDVIVMTIIGGIVGAIFITGVFVWQEIEQANYLDNFLSSKLIYTNINLEEDNQSNIDGDIDSSDWDEFEDKTLDVSYKHPAECTWGDIVPNTDATNLIECGNAFMYYEPALGFSYYSKYNIEYGKNYDWHNDVGSYDLKNQAEFYFNLNKSDNIESSLQLVDINGYDAYQFVIDEDFLKPCFEDHTKACVVESPEGLKKVSILDADRQRLIVQVPYDNASADAMLYSIIFNGLDTKNMTHIVSAYFTDGEKIYVSPVDKNKEGVFVPSPEFCKHDTCLTVLEGADLESFSLVSGKSIMDSWMNLVKDKNYVYKGARALIFSDHPIDAKTFVYLDYNFYRDKDTLYYYGYGWGKVDFVDLDTFEILSNVYSKDKNNVYKYTESFEILEGVDPDTFEIPTY
ncbi:DKNYY domain-containing protein [bacterium]|nr:DKNYY domain-containing protein [bacterium]